MNRLSRRPAVDLSKDFIGSPLRLAESHDHFGKPTNNSLGDYTKLADPVPSGQPPLIKIVGSDEMEFDDCQLVIPQRKV